MDYVEKQRTKEREDDAYRRKETARLEANRVNQKTLNMHEKEKKHFLDTKARYGRQSNSYAPDSLRMAAFGGQIAAASERGSSMNARATLHPLAAKDMPTATGVTKINPERLTTIRQVRHYEDNLKHIERERQKKADLRADLERQCQAKIFKRERERLRLDQKSLVTSKGLLQSVGASVPADGPVDEDATDLNLLKNEEDYTDLQVKQLQKIANVM